MKRIHIVGSGPRTGTTLLVEVMATCFHIDHSCEHESPICTDQPKEGNCFLTKKPGDFASVGLPLLLNPQLYVVCMIRDPRDSIVSFHGSRPGVYWTGLKKWKLFVKKYDKLAKHPRFVPVKYEDLVSDPDGIQKQL
ncbi:MAG: sulfotransferase, partial [Gammaproteobacteria bacterium]|nr:sulfotransferase [Gammaproteobacteria bacterium]